MSNVLHNSMGALAIAAGNHEEAIALLSKVDGSGELRLGHIGEHLLLT